MVGTLQSVQAINHRTAIMWFSEMFDTEKHQLLLLMVEYTAVYIVTTGGNTSIQLMIVHYHMFTIIYMAI